MGWDKVFEADKSAAWLGNGKLVLASCVIWGFPWVGSFAILTYLAKLQSIDKHIYEAADIDGAGPLAKFTRIELPLIMSSIYLLLVFVIIDTVKDAGMIIALTGGYGGGPGGVVTVPALFMLRQAFLDQQLGAACAVGIVLTVIVMSLQKTSTLVTTWSTLRPWQQMLVRLGALVVGILTAYNLDLPILGAVLIVAALPYDWLFDAGKWRRVSLALQMHLRADLIIAGVLMAALMKLQIIGTILVAAALPYEWIFYAAPWKPVGLGVQMLVRVLVALGGLLAVYGLNLPILGGLLVLAALPYPWVYDAAALGAATSRGRTAARAAVLLAGLLVGAWGALLLFREGLCDSLQGVYDLIGSYLVGYWGTPKGLGWAAGALLVVGAIAVLAALPYLWGLGRLRALGRWWKGEAAADVASRRHHLTGEERAERAFLRATDPRRRLQRRLADAVAGVAKHGVIWIVLAFAFLPMYLMMIVSLKTNVQFYNAPAQLTAPYHWENWSESWARVTPTVANSIFISIAATALTLLFAVGAAYFFARQKMPLSRFFWNAVLVLMMMPMIANLMPLFILLRDLSLLNMLTALIIVGASAGQVFSIFVLRSFVADIPQDLFEAAEIDGASHFQQIRTIVLPLAAPILGTVGVMQFIALWNDFVLPLIIIRDHAQLPVMVELLRLSGEYIKYWGPMMAGYTIASVPVIILFVFSMRLFIRGLTEGAIKG
jgi:ABC-type glycerol-3-phosphate transport system permease component